MLFFPVCGLAHDMSHHVIYMSKFFTWVIPCFSPLWGPTAAYICLPSSSLSSQHSREVGKAEIMWQAWGHPASFHKQLVSPSIAQHSKHCTTLAFQFALGCCFS